MRNLQEHTPTTSREALQDAWAARCRTDAPTLLAYGKDDGTSILVHKMGMTDAARVVIGLLKSFPGLSMLVAGYLSD